MNAQDVEMNLVGSGNIERVDDFSVNNDADECNDTNDNDQKHLSVSASNQLLF